MTNHRGEFDDNYMEMENEDAIEETFIDSVLDEEEEDYFFDNNELDDFDSEDTEEV